MSNWTDRERKILKLSLGVAEKAYDPLRLILNYNRAVRDKGGKEVLKSIWDKYHAKSDPEQTLTPEQELERDLQDAEGGLYLGELGAATFGETISLEGDGWTLGEDINALYQFLAYITKKEKEAGNSPTSASPELESQGETNAVSPSTQTTLPPS